MGSEVCIFEKIDHDKARCEREQSCDASQFSRRRCPQSFAGGDRFTKFWCSGNNGASTPDQRHIRYSDARELPSVVTTEYNIEGNPIPEFKALVFGDSPNAGYFGSRCGRCHYLQCRLGHPASCFILKDVIAEFKAAGIRTSIFVDPDLKSIEGAVATGTDRIELYTEAYAQNYTKDKEAAIAPYREAAQLANSLGLGVNAGHDLSLENIAFFAQEIPGLIGSFHRSCSHE